MYLVCLIFISENFIIHATRRIFRKTRLHSKIKIKSGSIFSISKCRFLVLMHNLGFKIFFMLLNINMYFGCFDLKQGWYSFYLTLNNEKLNKFCTAESHAHDLYRHKKVYGQLRS